MTRARPQAGTARMTPIIMELVSAPTPASGPTDVPIIMRILRPRKR